MEVAAGAMSPLLRKLSELLVDEYNLGKRVTKGVKYLATELVLMQAFLRKVGEVPSDELDAQVRIWAGKVRELSYDMEDAVDKFIVRVEEDGDSIKPTDLKKTTKLFSKGKAVHQIADDFLEAQEFAMELAEQRKMYELQLHGTGRVATIDPRLKAMYRDVAELVGIDGKRDHELINLVSEGEDDACSKKKLKIVSIVGFGGLGKTTLAQAVYDKIKGSFDCSAFVPVGRKPDVKKVLRDILLDLNYPNPNLTILDERQLTNEVRKFLEHKRYLIVIDDIWDEELWGHINCAFPNMNNRGSRLITTTRNVSVSLACGSSEDDIYKMKPLSDGDSQRLFYIRIFGSENECPGELEQVSRDILKKCGGVPEAIITIASLLASDKPKDQWLVLLHSIGRGLMESASVNEMKRILSFSYYDLPSHLKTCLLYI